MFFWYFSILDSLIHSVINLLMLATIEEGPFKI